MILDFRSRIWSLAPGAWSLVVIYFLSFEICTGQSNASVSSKTDNPTTQIIGKWKMVTVLEGNQDITPMLNPENDRWIEFKADRTFESGGGPTGANAGSYKVNEDDKTLHLDSDAGEGDDSNWRIQFREDLLYMRGIGTNRQEMTTVISQLVSD
jgi:hypothetical protein